MVRKSRTAVEYGVHDAHLRAVEVRRGEALGCAGELLFTLEALGVGLDDVARVLQLATVVTPHNLPAPLSDACAHYRIGVFQLDKRQWAGGAHLGAYQDCLFMAWTV